MQHPPFYLSKGLGDLEYFLKQNPSKIIEPTPDGKRVNKNPISKYINMSQHKIFPFLLLTSSGIKRML